MYEFVDQRTYITVGENYLDNVESTDFPGHRPNQIQEDSWNFDTFRKNFKIKVVRNEDYFMEFDFIGIDCAIANAFRRIMLSEIPMMAVEKVHYYLNTSVFQEEFLAHRLGLIPIKADPKMFEFVSKNDETHSSAQDTIVFELKAKCVPNPKAPKDSLLPEDMYLNRNVYSRQLNWEPLGDQEALFGSDPPHSVHDDILIAKLSPGQELDLKLMCVKGIGRDHAKFSPVCTAFYRFLPSIELTDKIGGEDAIKLRACFSPGVIELDKSGRAHVNDSRYDSSSRNIFLYPELKDRVKLGFKKDHFIFNVESTGALTSKQIVLESVDILMTKCRKYLDELESSKAPPKSEKKKKELRRVVDPDQSEQRLY